MIEEETGKKFNFTPNLKLINSSQKKEELITAFIKYVRKIHPEILEIFKSDEQLALEACNSFSGFYNSLDKTLYIIPDFIISTSDTNENAQKQLIQTFVHELVHALQDSELNLTDYLLANSYPESNQIKRTLIEGHADLIVNQIFKNPYYDDLEKDIFDLLEFDTMDTIYHSLGINFLNFALKYDSSIELWKILKNPPIKSEMLLNPTEYFDSNKKIVFFKPVWLSEIDKQKSFSSFLHNTREIPIGKITYIQTYIASEYLEFLKGTFEKFQSGYAKYFISLDKREFRMVASLVYKDKASCLEAQKYQDNIFSQQFSKPLTSFERIKKTYSSKDPIHPLINYSIKIKFSNNTETFKQEQLLTYCHQQTLLLISFSQIIQQAENKNDLNNEVMTIFELLINFDSQKMGIIEKSAN